MTSPRRPLSLEHKLPLLIAGILLAMLAGLAATAYREVRHAALATASHRLESVTRRLAGMLQASAGQRLEGIGRTAAEPALAAYVRTPDAPRAAAQAALRRALTSEQVAAAELWDSAGRRLLAVGAPLPEHPPPASDPLRAAASSGGAIGPFQLVNDTLYFAVLGALRAGDRTLGYVVERRRVVSGAAPQLAELIGTDAALLIGNADGGLWTNFASRVDAPPVDPRDTMRLLSYDRPGRGSVLAHIAPIARTPWVLAIEFPRAPVLAPVRGFVVHVVVLAAGFVLAGATVGWIASRRLTAPLRALTAAADAVAAGRRPERVPPGRPDELGRLAAAFNAMAEQVDRREQTGSARLEASETRFRALAQTANDAIVAADARGIITYFNPAAERIFGHAPGEAVGQPLTLLIPPRLRDAHRAGLARYIGGGNSRVVGRTVELTGLRKDGTEFPVELSLASWHTNGAPAFAGILRDISDRKQAEEARDHALAELQAVNRELEAFSYTVSHDLRAPLRAMDGFSRILDEDYRARLDDEGRRLLAVVRQNARQMGTLIDDLLAFSRLGRKEIEATTVDMGALVRSVIASARDGAGAPAAELVLGELPPARGDVSLLKQVWANLIQNAFKFSRLRPTPRIEIGARRADEEIVYYVTDNGVGFDMAYAGKLFGVFQRLHRPEEFEGTGVGLAIVQRIVHRHGGRVWAEGAVDGGATFSFSLPES